MRDAQKLSEIAGEDYYQTVERPGNQRRSELSV